MPTSDKPRYQWPKAGRTVVVYRPETVAKILNEKNPFFEMRSGGIYAVAMTDGVPTHFVRVDKDRRPRRQRKRDRQYERRIKAAQDANPS